MSHLLSSHWSREQQSICPPASFLRHQRVSQLKLKAMLLALRLFDYPLRGSCAGFHSFHRALTSVSWLPLSYFMRGGFRCLSFMQILGRPLLGLVFKRWILVLTREITLPPSLSPGCRPDCSTALDILGLALMQITLGEKEDAGCVHRCFFRKRLSDRNITPGLKPHWPFALPGEMRVDSYAATEPYMLLICSNTLELIPTSEYRGPSIHSNIWITGWRRAFSRHRALPFTGFFCLSPISVPASFAHCHWMCTRGPRRAYCCRLMQCLGLSAQLRHVPKQKALMAVCGWSERG